MIKATGTSGGPEMVDGIIEPDQLAPTPPGTGNKRLNDNKQWADPLKHFAESWNETYKISALRAREDESDAEATVDIALVPKGSGGIQAAITDGTAVGGNARGGRSVDLQVYRTAASRVASGANAVISGGIENISSATSSTVSGGQYNVASGDGSVVGGGDNNDATLNYTTIGGGQNNAASAASATVGGGTSNTASNQASTVGGGDGNVASGYEATVAGGKSNTAGKATSAVPGGRYASTTVVGGLAMTADRFSASGDSQWERVTHIRQTSDATPTVMGAYNNLNTSPYRIPIASDSTVGFVGQVVARRTDADNESAHWKIEGTIDNNAGTTALVGSVSVTAISDDSGGAWTVAVTANNTDDTLDITVTGATGKTIRWTLMLDLVTTKG